MKPVTSAGKAVTNHEWRRRENLLPMVSERKLVTSTKRQAREHLQPVANAGKDMGQITIDLLG